MFEEGVAHPKASHAAWSAAASSLQMRSALPEVLPHTPSVSLPRHRSIYSSAGLDPPVRLAGC